MVLSSDGPLFKRRAFVSGAVRGLRMPTSLKLMDQVRWVVGELGLEAGVPRCTACNGELEDVERAAVADVVPARTLIWGRAFQRCRDCGQVFWEGTHWERIRRACEGVFAPGQSGSPKESVERPPRSGYCP